jgi:predicted Rossmann fold nucleotide-binding protein DprA/Smf involved in DNA uptake
MTSRSDSSLAALLLTQRLVDTPAAPLKSSEYWALLHAVGNPVELLGRSAAEISELADVDPAVADRAATLADAATLFAIRLDEAEQSGLHLIASVDPDFPGRLVERLGRRAPPLLYAVGDVKLLETALLGVVGSRDVSEPAAEVARGAAQQAVRHGHGVVSGGAKGVDRLAMGAALDAGGSAVGVLADSLVRMTRDTDVRRAVGDGRLCLCTPYKPTAGFSVANAMGRNKLIYALSQATLVVAADVDKGGTWAGAVESLRRGTAPVVAWSGEGGGEGNAALVARGATAVDALDALFPLPAGRDPVDGVQKPPQLALDI